MTDTISYRAKGFTTLLGAELHAPQTHLGDLWHILAVGLPTNFAPTGKKETGPQLARRARQSGAYVAVAHPAWYDLSDQDVLSIRAAHAIEIVNTTCMQHSGKGDSIGYLDRLLSQGHRYHAIATDDAHFNPVRPDMARNWVMVRASKADPEALLSALHTGSFYASQGPLIRDIKINRRRTMTIRTSPVRAVRLCGRSAKSAYVNSKSDLTKVNLDLSIFRGSYARLTVIDKQGRSAWTNPFWL